MKGVYIISGTLINLSKVRAIYGSENFVYFEMGSEIGDGYNFDDYDFHKVLEDIKYMQQIGAKVWDYNYEEVSD